MPLPTQPYSRLFRSSAALALALAASGTLSLSTPALAGSDGNGPAADTPTQLPRGAYPTHYAIRAIPDAQKLRFSASAAIDIAVTQATDTLTLNAADLTISSAELTAIAGGERLAAKVTLDTNAQTVRFAFGKTLAPGRYRLATDYAGTINTQANGLFALDYKDSTGQQKRALFTQFEAPDARRFVPSFDEPSFKATFDLSVTVPNGQLAVSNMPVASNVAQANGSSVVTFKTSPRMSSYLLFLGMGELDRATKQAGATEVGVVTGRGNTPKARFALDAAVDVLARYNDYFGVPYPLPKLDNVAGPGQSQFFSAMENWGAIFTFERAMLVDPRSTSEATRRRVFEIVAHETAHQWFGNYVTMAWWDDLWLNEGFASWMATKVTDQLHPEWEPLLGRVEGRESAMGLDAFITTHPIVQKVSTVEEVSQAFDAITYEKGEAVIAMLESFAGETVWRDGIRSYMKRHAYGNTRTDDLWSAVEGAGAKGLTTIARDFITQPGIPMVKVEGATCANGMTSLQLSQAVFARDAVSAPRPSIRWHVPIRASVIGQPATTAILDGTGTVTVKGCGAYVINTGQAGYYRSLYPAENLSALAGGFTRLSSIDQLGLLADNWQLSLGRYQPLERALDLIHAVPETASDAILAKLPDYLDAMYAMGTGTTDGKKLAAAYTNKRLIPLLDRAGYDARPGEGPQMPLLRQNLIATLGDMGNARVLAEARRRFAALSSDPAALDGPLKFVWLGIVARHATPADWDRIRQLAHDAPSALERQQYFTLLGRTNDRKLARRALDLAMTDEPGQTTSAAIIAAVADDNSMMAVDYVLAHKAQYDRLVDASARSQSIARLGAGSASPVMATKLKRYADRYLTADSRKVVDRAIAAIQARASSRTNLRPGLITWLRQHQ